MKDICRIAMWSGPRNISTALMRSWESRSDTAVMDEPLYAHYLQETRNFEHPGYKEIIDQHETDWRIVVDQILGPTPGNVRVLYQKQMAHHVLPHISLDWLEELTNIFLIRDPREMLLSLLKYFPDPKIEATGLPQQVKLFQKICQSKGTEPVVVDAKDILIDPAAMLKQICKRVGIPYDKSMLSWLAGLRKTDGVWARYWYDNVARSTCFAPYEARSAKLPAQHHALWTDCQKLYDFLAGHKLSTGQSADPTI